MIRLRPIQSDAHAPAPELDRISENTVTVRLSGEIDTAGTPQLASLLEEASSRQPQEIVVDLSEVSFLGCTPLAVFANARHTAQRRGITLCLQGAAGTPRRLLIWAGLGDLL